MFSSAPVVCVVDDDESTCRLAASVLEPRRLQVAAFPTAEQFLAANISGPIDCLVVALRLGGMGGIELLGELARRGFECPTVVVSADFDSRAVVDVMRAGAAVALPKPLDGGALADAVDFALANARPDSETDGEIGAGRMIERLTPAEREIAGLLTEGYSNKAMARRLGVSLRTIEQRRHNIFVKLEVDSLAALLRLLLASGRLR